MPSSRKPQRAATAGAATPSERRTRPRLRELCDEVLASFRVARGRDLFSDSDRAAAHAMMKRGR